MAELEGAEPAPPPPFGRRTDAVTVLVISENGTVLWRVLNFDRSAVNMHFRFRILKMIATSGFLTALECTKFVFGRGSALDPAGGAFSVSPNPLARLKGTLLLR